VRPCCKQNPKQKQKMQKNRINIKAALMICLAVFINLKQEGSEQVRITKIIEEDF
jgi:hypothetical protein